MAPRARGGLTPRARAGPLGHRAGRVLPGGPTSRTLGQDMMYVAVPVRRDGKTIGVLRTAMPVTAMDQALRAIQWKIALGGAVVALLAAGVSLFVSRRISPPLGRLTP